MRDCYVRTAGREGGVARTTAPVGLPVRPPLPVERAEAVLVAVAEILVIAAEDGRGASVLPVGAVHDAADGAVSVTGLVDGAHDPLAAWLGLASALGGGSTRVAAWRDRIAAEGLTDLLDVWRAITAPPDDTAPQPRTASAGTETLTWDAPPSWPVDVTEVDLVALDVDGSSEVDPASWVALGAGAMAAAGGLISLAAAITWYLAAGGGA